MKRTYTTMKTFMNKEEKEVNLNFENDLLNTFMKFKIIGQTPDRSFEDRDVYIEITKSKICCGKDDKICVGKTSDQDIITEHLRGENAIELGLKLIEAGKFSLEANMINHQLIHSKNEMARLVKNGVIEKVILTVIDENPANYGGGFRLYSIKPVFTAEEMKNDPIQIEFEDVIYFDPTAGVDYKATLSCYYGDNIEIIGYDREAEVKHFMGCCASSESFGCGDDIPDSTD